MPSTKDKKIQARALPSAVPISQSQVIAEFNKGSNLRAYLGAAPGVPTSGTLKLTDFLGKASGPPPSIDLYVKGGTNVTSFTRTGLTSGYTGTVSNPDGSPRFNVTMTTESIPSQTGLFDGVGVWKWTGYTGGKDAGMMAPLEFIVNLTNVGGSTVDGHNVSNMYLKMAWNVLNPPNSMQGGDWRQYGLNTSKSNTNRGVASHFIVHNPVGKEGWANLGSDIGSNLTGYQSNAGNALLECVYIRFVSTPGTGMEVGGSYINARGLVVADPDDEAPDTPEEEAL